MGVKRKRQKLYEAVGYNFQENNQHLLGMVGQTHALDEWIRLAFPKSEEWAQNFFRDDTDTQVVEYMLFMMGLRLKKRTN